MKRRLPPLNAVRAFEVAARSGSFTLAAQELGVSQGAVSRQIAHLEEFLEVDLFIRSHREVRLTPEGAEYANVLTAAFESIDEGTQNFLRKQRRHSLRLSLFPTFADRWLVPRLGSFHALHPEIDVQITTSLTPANLTRGDVDLTVEFRTSPQAKTHYDPLFEIELLPVCNPSILPAADRVSRPEDLLQLVLLHALNRQDDWKIWFKSQGIVAPVEGRGLQFGTSALVYQAATNGVGVAMAQVRFVEDDLESGRLVSPFPQRVATGEIYHLACLDEHAASPGIAAFRDWVTSEVTRSSPARDESKASVAAEMRE